MTRLKAIRKKIAAAVTLAGSFLLCAQIHAGTGIGSYPQLNGGFEGEVVGAVPVDSSIAAGTATTNWTVSASAASASISGNGPNISPTGGRSGPYCVTNYSCTNGTTRRLQSPTTLSNAIVGGASNVVQFYYRTPGATTVSNLQGGSSPSGTGIPTYSPASATVAGTSGVWTKFVAIVTNQAGTGLGIGVVRFAGLSLTNIDVDDFVIYSGNAVDNTPPDPITLPLVSTFSGESVTLSWTAPATGVDGGGYLVVRGATDPATAPLVNGIYTVSNILAAGQTVAYVGTNTTFTDLGLSLGTAYFYRIYTVDKAFNYSSAVTATADTASTLTPPTTAVVTPSSLTVGAGGSASYLVTLAAGDPPFSYLWYKETALTTNLIPTATGSTLTLSNVLGGDAGSYQVVVSNSVIQMSATSQVVTLTVTNDPNITIQPNSTFGLSNGTVQFTVTSAGTSPSYQWYQFDSNSLYTPYQNGGQPSGSTVAGAASRTLTLSDVQAGDVTNLVVVVYNTYGSVTSSVVSLISVSGSAVLTYWDFNGGTVFTGINPAPFYGVGQAFTVGGALGFAGATDPENGPGGPDPSGGTALQPNFSWGTDGYPATNANPILMSNKLNGVQFNVSTLGANNITLSYDARSTGTASEFERIQYTTNGTAWIDYPSGSSFNGLISLFYPFNVSFGGFPGVANNPNFGVRIVTEFESTATYGNSNVVNYVGVANAYGTAGTLTYDIVNFSGQSITNNDPPPTIAGLVNTNNPDYVPITLNFTVDDSTTSPSALNVSAASLSSYILPGLAVGGSGASRSLTITPIPGQDGVAPILVTVTNSLTGQSVVAWFYLTNTSPNLPPVTSLASLPATNVLQNTVLTIPFTVSDDHTANSDLVYTLTSDNNTLIPNANVVIGGTPASPTLVITPVTGQIGVALLTVNIADTGTTINSVTGIDPRSTTVNIAVLVRPNTNIVFVDEFDYDHSGALDTVSAGIWNKLSGNISQMQVGSGVVTVDTLDNTENLQAALLGGPYRTNTPAVLYASYFLTMNPTLDANKMPSGNGTYVTVFNDGSGTTGPYECRLVVATNGAAAGDYRMGVNNFGADATTGAMLPIDLQPGVSYQVVTALVLSNGFSTLWVNPISQYSTNVTDKTAATAGQLFNIAEFELRESGSVGGAVGISNLQVGTSFSAVTGIYPPVITNAGSATFPVGSLSAFAFGASGVPAPAFSVNGLLPGGVTFDPVAGVISGTPVTGSGGIYPLSVVATNVDGTNMQSFTLKVTPTNNVGQPPYNNITANLSLNPSQVQLGFTGVPGQSYVLQSASLVNGTFTDVPPGTPLVAGITGLVQFNISPTGSQQYFRVRTGP